MYNINIFTIISGATFLFAVFFGLYNIFNSPYKRSSVAFIIFSATVVVISVSNFFVILKNYPEPAPIWSYLSTFGALMFSPALFIFINDFLENKISSINRYIKILFYLPSLIIFIFLAFNEGIVSVRGNFGFIVYIPYMMIIGIFCLGPFLLISIYLIGSSIHNNLRMNRSNLSNNFLLSGVVIFTLGTFTLELVVSILNLKVSINTLLMAFLYIFIAMSILSLRMSIQNMTLRQLFGTTSDCIMVSDPKGNIISINNHMQDILYKGIKTNKYYLDSEAMKKEMFKASTDKNQIKKLFTGLKSGKIEDFDMELSCNINGDNKTYNVRLSPVLDSRKSILAKVAVFRDITKEKVLQERLRKKAIKDFLTKAYNRRYFFEQLAGEIKKYHRYKNPFTLMMIDIDGFKRFNDTYGHLKGDLLLKEAVDVFKENIRQGIDIITRYGGDEFVILLPDSDISRARKIADRIIEKFNIRDIKGTSLSIGICQYSEEMTLEDLINCSDSLMYEAKMNEGSSVKMIL